MSFFNKTRVSIAAGILVLGLGGVMVASVSLSAMQGGAPGVSVDAAPASDLSPLEEQGRYLATISNCQTCHTAEGGKPFAGGLGFNTPFGTLYSTNITQDKEHGIGTWSEADFQVAMRRGVRPDGKHLYPVFPYTAYTKFSDDDITALYAYMKTVTPVSTSDKLHDLGFPYNINALLWVWKALFLEEGPYIADDSKSDEWNRGAYLVEGPGHCAMCHTPRNFLGGEQKDLAYTGSVYVDKIRTGDYRDWSTSNLTSAEVGLAGWRDEDLYNYLKTGVSKRAITFGPMNEVIMNSTRHLNDNDAKSMVTYLKSLPANAQPVGELASANVLAAGQELYTIHCGTCHLPTGLGAEGKGGTVGDDLGVPLVGSAVVQAPDPATLINNILYGPELPPRPFDSGRREMKPFALKMSDDELAKLASYVRSAWGNGAGAVTAEQVSKQR